MRIRLGNATNFSYFSTLIACLFPVGKPDTCMKRLLLICWLPLTLTACLKKDDGPAPDASTVIAGDYQLKRTASFINDQPGYDIILPQIAGGNIRTGTVQVIRKTESTVSISVIPQVNGTAGTPTTFSKMTVKAVSSGYELYLNNKKNGTADGSSLIFEVSDTTPGTMEINRYLVEAKR